VLDINSGSPRLMENGANSNNSVHHNGQEIPRPQPKLVVPSVEPEKNYLQIFIVLATILVIVVAALLYVLSATKTSQLKTKTAEASDLEKQLAVPAMQTLDKQIQSFQSGLKAYQTILSGKVYWSKMFLALQTNDIKNVKFNNFTMDDSKKIKITGETDDYTSIAKLMTSLTSSGNFINVNLVSATRSTDANSIRLNFVISLDGISSTFKETAATAATTIDTTGNSVNQ